MTDRCRDLADLLIAATLHELPAADRQRLDDHLAGPSLDGTGFGFQVLGRLIGEQRCQFIGQFPEFFRSHIVPSHEADFVSDQWMFNEMYGHTPSFLLPEGESGSDGFMETAVRRIHRWPRALKPPAENRFRLKIAERPVESKHKRVGQQVVVGRFGVAPHIQGGHITGYHSGKEEP